MPWSVPKRTELWHVLIGVVVGFILAAALIGVSGRMLALNLIFVAIGVIPFAVLLINAVAWFHQDLVEQKERQRKLADEIFWLKDANRAASNKSRGLGWTGRHPRRR